MTKDNLFQKASFALMPLSYFRKESRGWLRSPGSFIFISLMGILAYVHLLLLWYTIDFFQSNGSGYVKSPFLLLSRFNGQMAIVLFTFEFILAIRTRFIERWFGGFDRVYKLHSIVGRIAFYVALLHFVFLLASTSREYLSYFILPSSSLPVLLGQLSLGFFFVLIIVSVWRTLPHHIWLLVHKCIGAAFMLSGFHMFLIQPKYLADDPYRMTLFAIWLVGMFCWVYRILLYRVIAPHHMATVQKVERLHEVTNLYLKLEGSKFDSRPGDFVWISMDKTKKNLIREQHPFSISGYYEGNVIRLSIKDLGDFTHIVPEIQEGDTMTVFGPYGKFDDKLFTRTSDMVWIGAGIGIAPFVYMSQYFGLLPESGKQGKRKVHLWYVLKNENENLFEEQFRQTTSEDSDFSYSLWHSDTQGFIRAQDIVDSVGGVEELKKRTIFICGPIPMMESLTKDFYAMGVSERNIVFEEFRFG